MEKITDLTQVALNSLTALGESFMSAIPNILGGLFLILLGWLLARLLSFLIQKTLRIIGFDKLSEKLHWDALFGKRNIGITPSQIVGKFVYWIILLLFFVTASDTLGWEVVSVSISQLIAYLPKLFSAIVIFVIGFYVANLVKNGIKGVLQSLGVSSSRIVSGFAYYLILVLVTLTSLNQAGIDTEIVTSNVIIVIGGAVLAFAISFGFGSRDILSNILSSFYTKNNFHAGQEIEMRDIKGTIEKIDVTSCIIKTKEGPMIVVPVKKLLTENIKINKAF